MHLKIKVVLLKIMKENRLINQVQARKKGKKKNETKCEKGIETEELR